MVAFALFAACSSGGTDKVKAAQARVTKAQQGVTDAQANLDKTTSQFCSDTKDYINTIDRYGKVFDQSAVTVGDVKTAGADLAKPQATVESSAGAVSTAGDALAKANQELVDAQAALVEAQASAASQSLPPTTQASTTTTTPLVSVATVDRVKKAEADFESATQSVTDQTPLAQATVELNSAGFALQATWLQLLKEAGCLTDEQDLKAVGAIQDYTVALQTALQTTGFYQGDIDGIYGPTTAQAVESLQAAHGLPQTGWLDRATSAALDAELASKGSAVTRQSLTQTAAVQSTLKLAGYWTGLDRRPMDA